MSNKRQFRFFPVPRSTYRIIRLLNSEISQTSRLSDAQTAELCAWRDCKPYGESLRPLLDGERELVRQNVRLVRYLADHFRNDTVIPYLDLFQQGAIGLMIASENWQPELGHFGPFASQCIRKLMITALIKANLGRGLYVPAHVRQLYTRLDKARRILRHKNAHEPDVVKIAIHTGISESVVTRTLALLPDNYSDGYSVSIETSSYVDDGLAEDARDIIDDEPQVDELVDCYIVLKKVFSAFEEDLTNEQRIVLCHRFGFCDHVVMTLVDIGKTLGLDGSQTRRIEQSALLRLRSAITKNGQFSGEFNNWP